MTTKYKCEGLLWFSLQVVGIINNKYGIRQLDIIIQPLCNAMQLPALARKGLAAASQGALSSPTTGIHSAHQHRQQCSDQCLRKRGARHSVPWRSANPRSTNTWCQTSPFAALRPSACEKRACSSEPRCASAGGGACGPSMKCKA